MRKKNKNQVPEMRWWCAATNGNGSGPHQQQYIFLFLSFFRGKGGRSEYKRQKKEKRRKRDRMGEKRILDDIQAGPIITSFWSPPASSHPLSLALFTAFSSCTTTTTTSKQLILPSFLLLRPIDSNNNNNKPRPEGREEKRVSSWLTNEVVYSLGHRLRRTHEFGRKGRKVRFTVKRPQGKRRRRRRAERPKNEQQLTLLQYLDTEGQLSLAATRGAASRGGVSRRRTGKFFGPTLTVVVTTTTRYNRWRPAAADPSGRRSDGCCCCCRHRGSRWRSSRR